jgi:apolipoprotein N-acyltransferase
MEIDKVSDRRRVPLLIFSAVLLTLAFPRFDLEPLAFVAFVPFFYAAEGLRGRRAFWLGMVFGIHWFVFLYYWLAPVSMFGFLLLVIYQSLFTGAFMFAFTYVRDRTRLPLLLTFPVLWVALEYARSVGYLGFPWGLLAHTQYKWTLLIQVADLTGAWGVSFVVAAVNVLVYYIAKDYRTVATWLRAGGAVAGIFLILNLYGALDRVPEKKGEPVRVGLLQGNIDQAVKWDPVYRDKTMSIYRELAFDAARAGAEIIIWPETSTPFYVEENKFYLNQIFDIAESTGTYHLIGSLRHEPRDEVIRGRDYSVYNAAFLVSPDRKLVYGYDKVRLVPFGEHIPWKWDLPALAESLFADVGDFTRGSAPGVFETPQGKFGVYICFESIFPDAIYRYSRLDADFVVNITNEAWFGRSNEPYQHLAMSVFRAVENKTWLVRAANTGVTCFISPNGRIVRKSKIYTTVQLTDDVYPRSRTTLYARYPRAFPYLILAVTGALILGAVYLEVRDFARKRKEGKSAEV